MSAKGRRVWPGKPYPLGAAFDGFGTNFALFSSVAERVQLCLFDGRPAGSPLAVPACSLWLFRRDSP